MNQHRRIHRRPFTRRDERGQLTAWAAISVPTLMLIVGLVVDGGLALAGRVRAADVAADAARTGAQQLDLASLRSPADTVRLAPGRARAAAESAVRAAGDQGRVRVSGQSVTVTVTHRQPTQILALAGITAFTVRERAAARAERGITGPENTG